MVAFNPKSKAVLEKLLKEFKPIVLNVLPDFRGYTKFRRTRKGVVGTQAQRRAERDKRYKIGIEFESFHKDATMYMYYITVELIPCKYFPKDHETGWQVDELKQVAEALETFWFWEDERREVGKRYWLIGDGDDSMAVRFRNGKFYIWLRSWDDGLMGVGGFA